MLAWFLVQLLESLVPHLEFVDAIREQERGKEPSTLLISPAPKPVKVRLCLGLEKPGPTGPLRSVIGAPVDGRRCLGSVELDISPVLVLLPRVSLGEKGERVKGIK